MYRLKNGRFEEIGLSWVKHTFYTNNMEGCGIPCSGPGDGSTLNPGCSDPRDANHNGMQTLMGPMWQVNAFTGYFPWPTNVPTGTTIISNRLQVHESDLDQTLNEGASYFAQVQHIHFADSAAGNAHNNASYRGVRVDNWAPGHYSLYVTTPGQTQVMQAAIRAWKDTDPSVRETDAQVPGEGLFILAAKVTDLGTGFFHYEYALQNLNSDRSGGSFTVPIPAGALIRNLGFHDVDYHDGDGVACPGCVCAGGTHAGLPCIRDADCPSSVCNGSHINFDGTDWPVTVDRCGNTWSTITWSTTPYAVDPNANALRWSTLYNFRFDANVFPDKTTVTLGLFKPGIPLRMGISTIGPELPLPPQLIGDSDCDGDVDLFDYGGLQACFSGAIGAPMFVAPSVGCLLRFDFDYDGDVDLADYKVFFLAYTRP